MANPILIPSLAKQMTEEEPPSVAANFPKVNPTPKNILSARVAIPGTTSGSNITSGMIPRPDYANQSSRNQYLGAWQKKYGPLNNTGDTILKLNEIPRGGKTTAEEMAKNAASKFGLDPALLHTSSMLEGESGLFKDLSGKDTQHRAPGQFGYQDYFGDKDFPINANQSFGMPDFAKRFPDLVSKGYLPKNFSSQFRGTANAGQFSENDFKSPEAAMQGKAALMKMGYDYVDDKAKEHGINLSPKQRDFFALAFFNGGEGGVLRRMVPYYKKGYLKDDKFLDQRPPEEEAVKGTKADVYGHVIPRIKMASNLKKEGYFR